MHHIAIMKKEWGLLEKIISGQKTIESRWYRNKSAPWGRIEKGDMVYFKNSGGLVDIKAEVSKVISFLDLTPGKTKEILIKYYKADGLEKNDINKFYKLFRDKKYCLLIFLKNPLKIRPFEINKKGFGAMAAWITLDNINTIKN